MYYRDRSANKKHGAPKSGPAKTNILLKGAVRDSMLAEGPEGSAFFEPPFHAIY